MAEWLPALDGVVARLQARRARRRRRLRARRVDDPHGAGLPGLSFAGFDYHEASIATARERAAEAGVADRVHLRGRRAPTRTGARATTSWPSSTPSTTSATRWPRHGTRRRRSPPDGTCLLVEPYAGDRVEDNLNPVGRLYYGFSTLVCTPGSLSQPGRAGLGTQAGEARLRETLQAGGFAAVRRAAQTPLNLVLEARLT